MAGGIPWNERLSRKNFLEVFTMCNNCFGNNSFCWIILLICLLCGTNGLLGNNNNGCDNNNGCGCGCGCN